MKKEIIGGCWIAAFVLGWLVGRQPVTVASRSDADQRVDRSEIRQIRKWSPDQRLDTLNSLAALPHPLLEDRLEMEKHLARLPLEDVKRLCMLEAEGLDDPFGEPSEGESGNSILRNIAIEEWCQRDPFGMLDSGNEWSDRDLLRIVRAAAFVDPERARNLAIIKSGLSEYSLRTGLLQALAEVAPEFAFATARGLPQEEFEYMDEAAVAEGFHDPLRKLEWADLIFELGGSKNQPAIYQIIRMIAEDDSGLFEKYADRPVLRHYRSEVSGFIQSQRWKNIPAGNSVPLPNTEELVSVDDVFEKKVERWFARDPAAVVSWLDEFLEVDQRRSQLAGLARAATLTDLQSLDRMMETFTSKEDLETIQRCAVSLLSDGNTSTRSALLAFVAKHPMARQYVRRPHILEP